jgi:hypothetical protein
MSTTALTIALTRSRIDAAVLATRFKQGRKIAPKVAAVLATLARMGFVDSAEGGKTFVLRRAV